MSNQPDSFNSLLNIVASLLFCHLDEWWKRNVKVFRAVNCYSILLSHYLVIYIYIYVRMIKGLLYQENNTKLKLILVHISLSLISFFSLKYILSLISIAIYAIFYSSIHSLNFSMNSINILSEENFFTKIYLFYNL